MAAARFRGRGHVTNGPLESGRPTDGTHGEKSGARPVSGQISVLLSRHRPARDLGEPEREGAQPWGFRWPCG
jgi:hypothetical protein